MIMNYGACAVRPHVNINKIDVVGWEYRTVIDPNTGMKKVYLDQLKWNYAVDNPSVTTPTIQQI